VEPGRANVVAVVPGARRGPTLLLNGHLDTSWSGDPLVDYPGLGELGPYGGPQATIVGDAIFGLGAFNMKGGLAAAALALVELARGPRLRGSVVFAGVCGESEKAPVPGAMSPRLGGAYRGRGVGARHFLRRGPRIDFAVVAGPSALHVVNGQAGSLFVQIAVCGQPAYLDRRAGAGEAPLDVVAALLPELRAWGVEYRSRHAVDTGLGRIEPGLTVGAIEGGWPFAPSTSPAVGHVYLDLRVAPGQSSARAVHDLRGRLADFAAGHPSIRLKAGVFARGRGTATPPEDPLVRTAIDVLEEDLELAATPYPAGSGDTSNDTNVFRRHGIPAIKVGPSDRLDRDPGMTASHGPHVGISDLVAAQQLYVGLARRLVA
jgi:acetylornithine deacetylase/succinyl-diaminopimelate desuccinylase-like protein